MWTEYLSILACLCLLVAFPYEPQLPTPTLSVYVFTPAMDCGNDFSIRPNKKRCKHNQYLYLITELTSEIYSTLALSIILQILKKRKEKETEYISYN